jgi:phosphoserine aminotransferase
MEKPKNIKFSSGPCAKHIGWSLPSGDLAGRSHRSKDGMRKIREIIALQRKILEIPDNYYVGIVSASSTGAMETLLWSLLGARGIEVVAQCIFSHLWARDIVNELKLKDVRVFDANFPNAASIDALDFDRDVVFCWTSTTSGITFRNADWIKPDRKGLTICDAASAAFVFDFNWEKLDATAFSWQKGLGGEAGFGTIVLGPRAIERLKTHVPSWPMPRIFKLAENGQVNFDIFDGKTINTPSMLCLEDFYNILSWAKKIGGIHSLMRKVADNYYVVERWISQQSVFKFLAEEKYRAHHIACLDIVDDRYVDFSKEKKWDFLGKILEICKHEGVGVDFLGHAGTEPHIRIWIGPTIEASDIKKFLPWLEYAYNKSICK